MVVVFLSWTSLIYGGVASCEVRGGLGRMVHQKGLKDPWLQSLEEHYDGVERVCTAFRFCCWHGQPYLIME